VTDEGLEKHEVIPFIRFLEKQPLSKDAPLIRRELLRWEERNSKEVDVLVCPGLLAPLPNEKIQFNSELIVQYMLGIMSYQLANPSARDHSVIYPAQVAGLRSLLRSYRVIVAQVPGAQIPEYDELIKQDDQGKLDELFRPLVAKKCSWPKA
jgi:hypothetical protein